METRERHILPDGLGIGDYKTAPWPPGPITLPAAPPRKPPTAPPAPVVPDVPS